MRFGWWNRDRSPNVMVNPPEPSPPPPPPRRPAPPDNIDLRDFVGGMPASIEHQTQAEELRLMRALADEAQQRVEAGLLIACDLCGAMVSTDTAVKHAQWHLTGGEQ